MLDRKAAAQLLKKLINESVKDDRGAITELNSVLTKQEVDTLADLLLFLISGWMRQQ